jgi:hydroxyethylthiazole kinase-like uncharacterized protein yjeF
MERVVPGLARPLHDIEATRRLEATLAAGLPAHTLMQRAGRAVARLARALAPHARHVWVACGPGNNGGDGLEAAALLAHQGLAVTVTWLGTESRLPEDARASLAKARSTGVRFEPTPPSHCDLAIDALFGIGQARPLESQAADWAVRLSEARQRGQVVLAVDLPSGLGADTGSAAPAPAAAVQASHTLSLLTLKPGLYTAQGRDAAGEIWWDDLGARLSPAWAGTAPVAWLSEAPRARTWPHTAHKGSRGDVAVLGGARGMVGAALLAATAAASAGAGRVLVALLDGDGLGVDPTQPELMFRAPEALDLRTLSVVCGCGAGASVRDVLPRALSTARALVLDADALNAIAADNALGALLQARTRRGGATVLTPHPLEAARLLGCTTAQVQADRLAAARQLVEKTGAVVVIKGSGTVIAAPGQTPRINPTGNGRLATGGTGDVLAGWIGALLAQDEDALQAAVDAVYAHGLAGQTLPSPLRAGDLARSAR